MSGSGSTVLDVGQGKHQRENTSHQLRNLLIIGAVVLVVIILWLAWYIPPTDAMDEYRVSRLRFGDAQYGPLVERLQWLLTPIHLRMVEFGIAPDQWFTFPGSGLEA